MIVYLQEREAPPKQYNSQRTIHRGSHWTKSMPNIALQQPQNSVQQSAMPKAIVKLYRPTIYAGLLQALNVPIKQ
jgi:hypothetical protein